MNYSHLGPFWSFHHTFPRSGAQQIFEQIPQRINSPIIGCGPMQSASQFLILTNSFLLLFSTIFNFWRQKCHSIYSEHHQHYPLQQKGWPNMMLVSEYDTYIDRSLIKATFPIVWNIGGHKLTYQCDSLNLFWNRVSLQKGGKIKSVSRSEFWHHFKIFLS